MRDFTPIPVKEVVVPDTPFASPKRPQRSKFHFKIDPELGSMSMDNLQSRYFGIGETHFAFNHDVMLIPGNERQTHFGLAIMDNYQSTVQFDNGDWIEMHGGESYLTFNPGVEEFHRFKGNHPMMVNFIQVDPHYLTNILMEQEPARGSTLYNFRERVIRNQFAGAQSKFLSPSVRNIVSAMFNCPLDGTLGNMMLEGNLQQLLALQFAVLGNDEISTTRSINRKDRDIMNAVRDHLQATFTEDHSLVDLSKKFGINQNKLKTQFREMFGIPVIGYLYDLKMEHARKLLLDKEMFVNEVSSIVGYRNPNHFATAFKRKFGLNPSKLKG